MKKNYFKSLMQVALLLAAPFVVSSCDDIIGQEDNPVASYIQWKNDPGAEVTMKIGDKKVIATATAVSSAIIAYESSDTAVAIIDPVNAEITAKAVGETTISAVISGMSTNGRSVFEATKISFKLIVKDGKCNLKLAEIAPADTINYSVNADSIIDASKFFVAYPAEGTKVEYSLWKENATKDGYEKYTGKHSIDANTGKLTLGNESGEFYIHGKITDYPATEGYTKDAADEDNWTAMVKVTIKEAIAYINAKGEREILTADKYKELDMNATGFKPSIAAGTYYVTNTKPLTEALDINGDVTLIFKDGIHATSLKNIDDKKNGSTLNIFGEAKDITPKTPGVYKAWSPNINLSGAEVNAITNFKAINIYSGNLTANKAIAGVTDINVYGGKLIANGTTYAIKLSGMLTVNGGEVKATGHTSDLDNGFAIIGNVDILKGKFTATNTDYRAVNGTVTKGSKIKLYNEDGKEIADNSTNPKKITTVAP